MKETSFIKQNEEKWSEFEQILAGQRYQPEKLNDLFIQVTDDLSYARTFYPNRSVRVYLNGLAQRIFFTIYKNKKSRRSRLVAFWTDELPRLLYDARKDLLLSFLIFSLAMLIGALSGYAEPDFLRSILGDSYVEMTEENIRSGDPMAVYKQKGEFNMFLGITLNNLLVAFKTFIMGLFYAIGTIGSLIYNGVMLGAFQYFFIEKGLFVESFLAVWMHGAFEISSIVIAGAAGLTMGRGLVFPNTFSRMRSFQMAARRGMSIMVAVSPLFIVAGFTESYLTRHTDAPDALRAFFIFLCLGFVLFYFVLFPRWKSRTAPASTEGVRLTPDQQHEVDFTAIKNTGELLTDTIILYRRHFRTALRMAAAGAAVYCAGAFLLFSGAKSELFTYDAGWFGTVRAIPGFFQNKEHPWLFPLITLVMAATCLAAQKSLVAAHQSAFQIPLRPGSLLVNFLKTLVPVLLLNIMLLNAQLYTVLLMGLVFPVLFLWTQVMLMEKTGLWSGLTRSFSLLRGAYGQMLGLFFTLLLCGLLLFLLMDTGLLWFLLEMVSMNFFLTEEQGAVFSTVLITFLTMLMSLLIFSLWTTGSGLQYFSNLEIQEAEALKNRLQAIGKREKIRGLERES